MKIYIVVEHKKSCAPRTFAFADIDDTKNFLVDLLYGNGLRDGGSVAMESDINNDGFMFGCTDTDELPEGYLLECIMTNLPFGA